MWNTLDPEILRLRLLLEPHFLEMIHQTHPELANAAVNDPETFKKMIQSMCLSRESLELERQKEISALNANPLNVEAQARIEEIIRQEAVMENLENAMEYHPESFGCVTMLYINVEINKHKIKAFVDSGAQNTIMSPSCAKACGIIHLIDKRFSGIAKGVGMANIIGRVHSAQIKVGPLFLACSFTIIEGKDIDILFGLDMLRSHQACIDLKKNALIINDITIPFLSEAELPDNAKVNTIYVPEPSSCDKQSKSTSILKHSTTQGSGCVSTQLKHEESKFSEKDIRRLESLGFSRKELFKNKKLEKKCGKNIKIDTQKQNYSYIFEGPLSYSDGLNDIFCRKENKDKQLTKLQQKMKLKLSGGKFRMINEYLYNITGEEALEFFKKHPEIYKQYHIGFQNQVSSWPKNPVDLMIEKLNLYMQKTRKLMLKVADLGCGDAKIAKAMKNMPNIKIYSYDLVSESPLIIACDISTLPLANSTIDIVIFCLSLMGTNYIDFLKEAWRILKINGELWIVEIKSRFTDNKGNAFCTALTSLGFSVIKTDISNKMFMCLYFKKVDKIDSKKDYGILLKSCIYKRR
ncbi:hypothetical protein PMAC_000226 [Pneumocystis sp. 'macacae']|nr:hypothetical protein PMAC_000226 [Pneumocystis sp. 'macacae']